MQISKHDLERAGHAPFADLDNSPIYLGSAIFTKDDGVTQKSVHPCKIGMYLQLRFPSLPFIRGAGPHLYPSPCSVAYGGREVSHHGRYDLLCKGRPESGIDAYSSVSVFDPHTMEWVPTSHGHIPQGRTPVEGGVCIFSRPATAQLIYSPQYEENIRDKLYHASARVNGLNIPGKTGQHLYVSYPPCPHNPNLID